MVTVKLNNEICTFSNKQNAIEELTTKLIQAEGSEQTNIAKELYKLFDIA